jgi:CarboxypepD_reg-like domain
LILTLFFVCLCNFIGNGILSSNRMTMLKNVQIRIDDPCSEPWDRMHPKEEGRFCSSCQKTVVDFTGMSDQEVLNWFAMQKRGVCGRFREGQLNHELTAQPQRKNGRLGWWRYVLAGLLLSSEVSAQTSPAGPPVSQRDSTRRDDGLKIGKVATPGLPHSPQRPLPDTLRGRLVDSANGKPISYASITTGRYHGVAADPEGYFAIPRSAIADGHTLTISCVGYKTIVIDAAKTWMDGREQVITLGPGGNVLGEVVVAGGVAVVTRRTRSKKIVSLLEDSLAFTGLTKSALTVYPNPVARGASITLSVRLDEPGVYAAQLFSLSGTLIETIKVVGDEKSKDVQMNIPVTVVAGTYFVRLSHPALKKVYTQQVLVF